MVSGGDSIGVGCYLFLECFNEKLGQIRKLTSTLNDQNEFKKRHSIAKKKIQKTDIVANSKTKTQSANRQII